MVHCLANPSSSQEEFWTIQVQLLMTVGTPTVPGLFKSIQDQKDIVWWHHILSWMSWAEMESGGPQKWNPTPKKVAFFLSLANIQLSINGVKFGMWLRCFSWGYGQGWPCSSHVRPHILLQTLNLIWKTPCRATRIFLTQLELLLCLLSAIL